jgi:hypothetical protein
MFEEALIALEGSGLARAMRTSTYLYPLANVLHVLGAMSFFAAVAAMDVRALGRGDLSGLRAFIGRVRPVAVAGLVAQVATGVMLLAPEASHIGHNPAFRVKLAAILLGFLNVAFLEAAARGMGPPVPAAVRVSALLSLVFWLATAAAGRLIAYF